MKNITRFLVASALAFVMLGGASHAFAYSAYTYSNYGGYNYGQNSNGYNYNRPGNSQGAKIAQKAFPNQVKSTPRYTPVYNYNNYSYIYGSGYGYSYPSYGGYSY